MGSPLTSAKVSGLREIANSFGSPYTENKKELLLQFSAQAIRDGKVLKEYHDCLLFLVAYPENKELLDLTNKELERVSEIASNIMKGRNSLFKKQLFGTGIVHSQLQAAFTFDLVKWLVTEYPGQVNFNSFGAETEKVKEILSLCLPVAEREVLADSRISVRSWIKQAKGSSPLSDLAWLIQLLDKADFADDVKDHLCSSLQLYIDIKINEDMPSRTFGRIPVKDVFFHNDLLKVSDAGAILAQKLNAPQKLTSLAVNELIKVARVSLFLLYRETDPLTHTDPANVWRFNMGRGIDICLFGMKPARRMPLDSYIGYMAFKNGVPCAYGGGWILGESSKIGVNIYPPFRGGESAFLFCQILHLYHQFFHVPRITVEPYQIGKNNSEGVRSGAFWFYYKLGFRPMESKLRQLAEKEFSLITSRKGYRTSLSVLKQLANSNLELITGKTTKKISILQSFDLARRTMLHIANVYQGDRQAALKKAGVKLRRALGITSFSGWSASEVEGFQQFSIVADTIPGVERLSPANKKILLQLIKAKGSRDESVYIHLFQNQELLPA
jgi:hypothetical protein